MDSSYLSAFDLDSVLGQVLAFIRDCFQLPRVAVLLLDPGSGELIVRKSTGWPAEAAAVRIPVGKGIIGQAAVLRQTVAVPDVCRHEGYIPVMVDTRSEVAIPFLAGDKLLGVLDCQSDHEILFAPESVERLTVCSAHVSLALHHARMHEREQRLAAQLDNISAISRQITTATELNELLARFCALVLQSFPVDHVALLLVEDGRLVLRAHSGRLWLLIPEGQEVPANTSLCGRALVTQNPVLSNNVKLEADYVAWFGDVKSELYLPLISFGESIGVLTLSSTAQDAFDVAEMGAVESVADICAAAIQNAIHFDNVRHLAYRDGLTGVFNRRFFEMQVVQELERACRYHSVISLLMIDLDGFKGLNDQFGHQLGDDVLRQVSAIFVQKLRKADIICRFGGDEFAVLLPETTAERAHATAEKLRTAVVELQFPGVTRAISLSIGVASCPDNGRDRDQLLKAADDALYRAKQDGRNRTVVAQQITSSGLTKIASV
ncbi:MAG: diguanylate cyclase [Terriglobales bacterium]